MEAAQVIITLGSRYGVAVCQVEVGVPERTHEGFVSDTVAQLAAAESADLAARVALGGGPTLSAIVLSDLHRRDAKTARSRDPRSTRVPVRHRRLVADQVAMNEISWPDLVGLVRGYYPAGLDAYEPGFQESPEYQRLLAARADARRRSEDRWRRLVEEATALFGEANVWDTTHPGLDNCFKLRAYLRPGPDTVAVVLLASVLAPLHATYTVYEHREPGNRQPPRVEHEPQPETVSADSQLDRLARAHLGTSRAAWSLLETPVPDVSTFHTPLGRATLAQLLFTDDQQ